MYKDIPEAYIGKHMKVVYSLKNRKATSTTYTVNIDNDSEHFFITGCLKFDKEVSGKNTEDFSVSLIPLTAGLYQLPSLDVISKNDKRVIITCDDQYKIFVHY